MYEIHSPSGARHLPPDGNCWKVTESRYRQELADGRIWFGKDGNGVPRRKMFLSEAEGLVPWTWWPHEEVGHTDEARKEIQSIFGTQTAFDTPKPVRLIERVLRVAMRPGDTVLDFFAGSGTTAHAVAKLNAEDGGDRRFILVSSTEATEDQPQKNLCRDVCAERVRRVLGGYTNAKGEAVAGLGGGFAYLRARRIPKHRLNQRLEHAEVWTALQLLHGRGLTPWPGSGFAADGGLAYLAEFDEASLVGLTEWRARVVGDDLVVYSWAPERLKGQISGTWLLPIPQHLRDRFGR